jgi:type IV pilus biogenesis protein CpaD/CtpE
MTETSMSFRLLGTLIAGSLAACAESEFPAPERFPDDFGTAVRSNMAAQIIARDGEVETLAPAPGVRRSLAIERYQTDRVEQPVEIDTRSE